MSVPETPFTLKEWLGAPETQPVLDAISQAVFYLIRNGSLSAAFLNDRFASEAPKEQIIGDIRSHLALFIVEKEAQLQTALQGDTTRLRVYLQAAQTWFDITLAAPGDLILSDRQTALDGMLIQCQNVYSVGADQLDHVIDRVAPDIMESVFRLRRDPGACPAGMPVARPLTPFDIRHDFHELEKTVADFFAVAPVPCVQSVTERIRNAFSSITTLKNALQDVLPGVYWPFETTGTEETLALLRFPDERLQWAARDQNHPETETAQLIKIRQDAIEELTALPADMYINQPVHGHWVAGGRIGKPLPPLSGSLLLIRMIETVSPEPVVHTPDRLEWEETTGFFHAEFSTLDKKPMRVALAVIT